MTHKITSDCRACGAGYAGDIQGAIAWGAEHRCSRDDRSLIANYRRWLSEMIQDIDALAGEHPDDERLAGMGGGLRQALYQFDHIFTPEGS